MKLRCLLLGRKTMTNIDSLLKSRDITLTKVHLIKVVVFLAVMYDCESFTIRQLSSKEFMLLNCGVGEGSWESLGLPRRYNQSILKEISPEYSLEGLMLKLKLQYFSHLICRTDSFEKTLMLGKIEDRRMRWLDGITVEMDMSWVGSGSWWWTGKLGVLQSMGSQGVGHDWVTELNWIEYWDNNCILR